jgi:hypothetical protein
LCFPIALTRTVFSHAPADTQRNWPKKFSAIFAGPWWITSRHG